MPASQIEHSDPVPHPSFDLAGRHRAGAARQRDGVTYQRLADGSAVLVDASGNSVALNQTGADVWELCDRPAEQIVAALLERYVTTADEADQAVAALMNHLGTLDLLVYLPPGE